VLDAVTAAIRLVVTVPGIVDGSEQIEDLGLLSPADILI
jgi:hypothetical protein